MRNKRMMMMMMMMTTVSVTAIEPHDVTKVILS